MAHEIKNKIYTIGEHDIVIIEHEGKAWITWASLRDLLGFPPSASFPAIEQAADLSEGSFMKTLIPKPINSTCNGWVLNIDSTLKVINERLGQGENASILFGDIFKCFEKFRGLENSDLPDSGEDEVTSTQSSPQVNKDEAESSPDKEVVTPKALKELSDKFDDSMENLVKQLSANFEMRLKELEMVKYADQLADMAGRISNMEEQLHEYESQMRDFRLLIRSLKEATGSQVQTDIIMKLVKMVERGQTLE